MKVYLLLVFYLEKRRDSCSHLVPLTCHPSSLDDCCPGIRVSSIGCCVQWMYYVVQPPPNETKKLRGKLRNGLMRQLPNERSRKGNYWSANIRIDCANYFPSPIIYHFLDIDYFPELLQPVSQTKSTTIRKPKSAPYIRFSNPIWMP